MSRTVRISLVLASLALLMSLEAIAQWWSGDQKVKDEPWRKSNGTFGDMLLLTPDFLKFVEEWKKPELPAMSITRAVVRNKRFDAAIIFTGCTRETKNCNIEVDFIMLRPDGKEYGSAMKVAAWKNKPGAPKGILQVSEATLAFVIEPQALSWSYSNR